MAKGAQDWIARTDVLTQTLAEMIVRLKNGTPGFADATSAILNQVNTKIFSLSGKGVLYGGYVYISNDAQEKLGRVQLVLDGVDMGTFTFENLFNRLAFHPGIASFYLNQYDLESGIFTVGFTPFLTFETGVEIWYKPDGGVVSVHHRIHYAVI